MPSTTMSLKRPAPNSVKGTSTSRKKLRRSETPTSAATMQQAVAPLEREESVVILPTKIDDSIALPVLQEQQPSSLSSEDYQSLASSAVLQAALDRSRKKWTCHGIFERYWIKPETGKNARPSPVHNPDIKMLRSKGSCRIRIEPHIFEVEMFVDEKNKPRIQPTPPVPPRPYMSPVTHQHGVHLQAYRPTQQAAHATLPRPQPVPARVQPQGVQGVTPSRAPAAHRGSPNVVAPIASFPRPQQTSSAPLAPGTTTAVKTKAQDPVITMLAERASSDNSLKVLMKHVASGNATQEQLRIFQRHIDELTRILQEKERRKREQKPPENSTPVAFIPQSDGVGDTPVIDMSTSTDHSHAPQLTSSHHFQRQLTNPTPALPVVLQFTSVGSSEDRFLFPQHTILENISKQHELASFIVTMPSVVASGEAQEQSGGMFWQPVTMLVEVAYGREELLNHVRKWVKPPDEVRKHMREIMGRYTRAPDTHLAMRLPFKPGVATTRSAPALKENTQMSNKKSTAPSEIVTVPSERLHSTNASHKQSLPTADANTGSDCSSNNATSGGNAKLVTASETSDKPDDRSSRSLRKSTRIRDT